MAKPLSYSAISCYENCPAEYAHKYIWKTPRPDFVVNEKMQRGLDMHQELEDFINGDLDKLSEELEHFEDWLNEIKADADFYKAEMEFCFDEEWQPIDFKVNDGLVRGLKDFVFKNGDVLHVKDWKTGKRYDSHTSQQNLYGLAGLLLFPDVKEVHSSMVYLDLGEESTIKYTRAMLSSYKWVWERKVKKIREATEFLPRPSWKCRFCDFSQGNGGPCPN